MLRDPTPLERRVAATQLLLDDWKGRPFDWKAKAHCGRLLADHLRRLGYAPPLGKAGPFASALGARRALQRLGAKSLADVLDAMGLPRIPPAAALPGDIVELPADNPLGAMTVALGNGRVGGWIEEGEGLCVLQPISFVAAWRVDPR